MKETMPTRTLDIGMPLFIGVFPLLSLFICFALISGAPDPNSPASADTGGEAANSFSFLGFLFMGIALLLVLTKCAALVGNFYRWYYAWLYHSLELHLVLFILGLLAVIVPLSQPLSSSGGARVIFVFGCLLVNFHIRNYWLGSDIRSIYRVNHYTHA